MPKKNTNNNSNDPRTEKSIRDIKRAMIGLILKEPFSQIQAEQIMEAAPVNKNTFYKYYASKQDVLDSIREDMVTDLRDRLSIIADKSMRGGNTFLPLYKQRCSGGEEAAQY